MSWNPTVSTKENTLLKLGGGGINNLYRYLNKINLGLVDPDFEPEITTPTHYYDGALRLRDNDDDADLIFSTTDLDLDTDVDQYVRFPMITVTEGSGESTKRIDTVSMNKTQATLEGKTIVLTDNHVKGTSAVAGDLVAFTDTGGGVIDLRRLPKGTAGQYPKMNPAADGFVWQTPGSDIGSNVITDSMIASHTSTKITITAKGQLNSQIGYKDETSWVTDAMVAIHTSTKITITAKGQLNSNLVYNDQANSYSTGNQTFKDNMLVINNPAAGSGYKFRTLAIAATRDITLPLLTANDQFTFDNHPTTLLNKSMSGSSNTFTNITDSAIGAHTSTKITITAKGQLNSSIAYQDQLNSFAAQQFINVDINNPFIIRRGNNTVGADTGIHFRLQTSTPSDLDYGAIRSRIGVNTAGSETGYLDFYVRKSGTLQQAMVIDGQQVSMGYTGLRVVMDSSLITTASKTITWANLAGTPLLTTGAQSMAGKTVDVSANTFTNILDTNIAAHTSTKISITAKGQLNSAILYNDVDNALGAHYILMDKITTPATPAAGKIAVFADSGSGYLAMVDSSGVVTDITAGTGGGGGGTGDVVGGTSLGGVGIYKQENASHVLEFKGLNNGSVVTVTANVDGNTIDLGIAGTSITNSMLAGSIAYSKLSLSGSIVDADIAAHTSTKITITAKGQLNSNIFYKDANNDIGAFYVDVGEIAAPSAPGATKNRLYWDSTTHRPTWKDSSNVVRSLISAPTYIGSSLQILRTNSGATATEWATLDNFKVANFSSTGNGSTTAFNITHGMGSAPTYVIAKCINQNIHMTYTITSTQIQCTFATAPANTSPINIMWLAIP